MTGRILILKMGSTLSSLKARRGDFEDWIIEGLHVPRERVTVVDVSRGEKLPETHGQSAALVTGSHTMVTDREDWSERAAGWLRNAVAEKLPILGICYGHQLMAHALGGEVGNNPNGEEFGTVDVELEDAGKNDEILGCLPPRVRVHVGHTQSILRLPPGAVRLASNTWDANQAVRFGPQAWGVQFHPEFDAGIVKEYVAHHRDQLAREGQDPDRLIAGASGAELGTRVLRRFAEYVG
jgi:GMP synthase (glutamine-hydrolysing)